MQPIFFERIGVLGATGLLSSRLLNVLVNAGLQATAYGRSTNVKCALPPATAMWISVAPIWVLPEYFTLFEAAGVRRIVALSSTSRFTKTNSGDVAEQAVAAQLMAGEAHLQVWAEARGIEWVILRPTLIYDFGIYISKNGGFGQDKNIGEIARFIRRFGFFPVFGEASGLRQPVHVDDVAAACFAAVTMPDAAHRAYNLSGGETLTYRDMVARVFVALGRRPRLFTVPLWGFRAALCVLRCLPRYRWWSLAMAERMNRHAVFDHNEAMRALSFNPRPFCIVQQDFVR